MRLFDQYHHSKEKTKQKAPFINLISLLFDHFKSTMQKIFFIISRRLKNGRKSLKNRTLKNTDLRQLKEMRKNCIKNDLKKYKICITKKLAVKVVGFKKK